MANRKKAEGEKSSDAGIYVRCPRNLKDDVEAMMSDREGESISSIVRAHLKGEVTRWKNGEFTKEAD